MAEWVAHRGWSSRYPENTLAGIMAAIEAGAGWVEVDVQLAGDGVPVLFHDADLVRTTGLAGSVFDYSADELQALDASEKRRLGGAHPPAPIPRLSGVLAAARAYPEVTLFVEVKDESVARFGLEQTVDAVIRAIGDDMERCVLIAFDGRVLAHARQHCPLTIGWILEAFDAESHCTAESLQPEYLICNYKRLGGQPPWPGTWQWMLYEINDHETAAGFAAQGVELIETADIGGMLAAGREIGGGA